MDVPPGGAAPSPLRVSVEEMPLIRVSTSAQNAAMIGLLVEPVMDVGV